MKFNDDDQADASQVEDRRGQRFGFPGGRMGAGVGGLGLVGTLVYVALQALLGGGDPGPLLRDQERRLPCWPQSPAPSGRALSGSCWGVTSEIDPAKFIVCVETNVQSFWRHELPRSGTEYRPAKLILFSELTPDGSARRSFRRWTPRPPSAMTASRRVCAAT